MTNETTPLPAGRALDAEVAEKVMGATWDSEWAKGLLILRFAGDVMHRATRWEGGQVEVHPCCPEYSHSIAAAWLVVEKLGETFDWVSVARDKRDAHLWTVECADHVENPRMRHCVIECADTPALAICRAAVRAFTTITAERGR